MNPTASRSEVVSSFTIIKGSLIDETYAAFSRWDFDLSKLENLRRMQEENLIGARAETWLRDVRKVLNRRFDPEGRDRALVELAQAECRREIWDPILLWHMTRDEYLLRDFLVSWLYERYVDGAYLLHPDDLLPYLRSLPARPGVELGGEWKSSTEERVATGLLRIVADFGLLQGGAAKEFASYHLPDEGLLYVLHAIGEDEPNAARLLDSVEWRIYLMDQDDVEREVLRLHQYRELDYEVAGTLAQLNLPEPSALEYARKLIR